MSSGLLQFAVEELVGAHGMINYVDARTSWMDDIVKQAQWQGITQVDHMLPIIPVTLRAQPPTECYICFGTTAFAMAHTHMQEVLHFAHAARKSHE